MSMHDDEQRLTEIFIKIARIPKEKIDRALAENNIRDILRNPALLEPTPAELDERLPIMLPGHIPLFMGWPKTM